MNIIFANNSKSLNNLQIKKYNSNPGIGGTEYVTIKLIYEIKEFYNNFEVFLATDQTLKSEKIKLINSEYEISNSIIITPVNQFDYLEKLKYKNCRVILWSHHPHDEKSLVKQKIKELVSLGEYQYLSNRKISSINYIIKNLYPKPIEKKELKRFYKNNPKNFVYIGAIGPAKGLHLVLENWPKIRRKFKNCQLRIIGGNLYQQDNIVKNSFFIFSNSYENYLRRKIRKMDIEDRKSITFLGLLNSKEKDKILKESDIALLNPTGKSEAAPASPLECYCYGIPVIAGGDFGAFDNMKYFQELDLKLHSIDKINDFLEDSNNYKNIKNRAYKYAIENFKQNEFILDSWKKLFNDELNEPSIKLPIKILLKIKFREIFYRKIKYPLKKLRSYLV